MADPVQASSSDDANLECLRGAQLVEEGKLHEAAEVFRKLSGRDDLPDGLRAIMAVNLATVYDRMGHVDTAVQTYEYAVGITLRMFVWAQEARAGYLLSKCRREQAVEVWEQVLALPFLDADAEQRIRQQLESLANG